MFKKFAFILIVSFWMVNGVAAQSPNMMIPPFTMETASKFAAQAYSCILSEYPNKISHTMESDNDIALPRQLHPAFYGCYDWHSAVQGHWSLVKMIQQFPDLPQRNQIIDAINKNITDQNIQTEIAYFKQKGRTAFERPYGWAWLLKLTSELAKSNDPVQKEWFHRLYPLAETIKSLYYDYLPGLYYPIRRGVHENTAFGIAFALDYARAVGDKTFESFLIERAKFYFFNDRNIPASWEPEGEDFLSPSLVEADLMRRVLDRDEFVRWFKDFMPVYPYSLTYPAVVADREDPKGVNLDGLNLSRAWCMFELAKAIPDDSQTHRDLWQSGYRHAAEALPNVLSDNYGGTHWLASFAVYMFMTLSDIQQ
ncbi:MAG TPA: DUF2891 domain-containing protein [Prolixibacteraceae bacterium]|nr:DUF2891 domain-containing protein [Prolixibacteraceae bacterium]HPS11763.1 DUF2891 domain-containing protein [Prolixibacteraceae bacterium]